jgi:hypothetical protein
MYESYEKGQTFRYPEDLGLLCPWLVDSLSGFLRTLENGGTLAWRYHGTPYEKEIDSDRVTTEVVRCLDPTASSIVVKMTRADPPE